MERTVPETASEEIELYLRTYYSLLRAATEVRIRTLEEAHAGMNSLLHPLARQKTVDMSAFIYSLLRLPDVTSQVELVVLGQSQQVFARSGFDNLNKWQEVMALARRRRCYFDGENTLACLIASRSDIDDLVPILTAYQIEWNKLHMVMNRFLKGFDFSTQTASESGRQKFLEVLQIPEEDLERLETIWGQDTAARLKEIAGRRLDIRIQLLSGSLTEYRRAINGWWEQIEADYPSLADRPVYFVSSNPHSLINIVTGFALQHEEELVGFLENSKDEHLKEEWEQIQAEEVPSSPENFLYYLMKKYFSTPQGKDLALARKEQEAKCGIIRVDSAYSFDIEAQVIPLAGIDWGMIDPRLRESVGEHINKSNAVVLNIDYPLGLAAYQVLSEVAEHVREVLGVYITGKAATLNGVVGDVMIPNVVYDGQSRNSYIFTNCFEAGDVAPYLIYGSVLDGQKAVTVRGTFLQNSEYMDVFYREGYTDIEMEGGPYLSAIYEMFRPKRYPSNEIVNLYDLPFDLGMLHYASDKPLSKGKNLGVASLSYFGMDPTYATTVATLKRIFEVEANR